MNSSVSLWHPLPQRVAVFRALNLGDMLCAVPALRVLRNALPKARITLIGLAGARSFVDRFARYIDELIVFPGIPAFPEQPARTDELPRFYRRMIDCQFDVALQIHGSGGQSNAVVRALNAHEWAGFVPEAEQEIQGRLMAWPDDSPEIYRYLALMRFLGLPGGDPALEFPLSDADHQEADTVARGAGIEPARTIYIHAGARLASRRWPADRFAGVARAISGWGWDIALTGSNEEHALVEQVITRLDGLAANLCGRTSLGALASLLQRGKLLICNDTGISHVAAAVGAPSVVIASGSDVRRWAPLDAKRHSVLYEPMPCRPCAYAECPIGHPCALAVTVSDVLERVRSQLGQGSACRMRCG